MEISALTKALQINVNRKFNMFAVVAYRDI